MRKVSCKREERFIGLLNEKIGEESYKTMKKVLLKVADNLNEFFIGY